MKVIANGYNPSTVGSGYRVSGWAEHPAVHRWIAQLAESFSPEGRPDRRFRLLRVNAGEQGDFERVVAVPSLSKDDPIRGKPTFRGINDYRKGTSTAVANGKVTGETVLERPAQARRRGTWHRWAGWVTVGGLAISLAAVYLRRRVVT
jgi:hypothetical protein